MMITYLNRTLMLVSAIALVAMVVHISADVASKYLFNKPIYGTIEFVTYYYMAAVTVLPLAATQAAKEHVIVEVFTQKLRLAMRSRLDFFAMVLSVVYLSVLGWACLNGALRSFESREYQDLYFFTIPIWPARWVLFLGILGIAATMVWQLISRDYRNGSASDDDDDEEIPPSV